VHDRKASIRLYPSDLEVGLLTDPPESLPCVTKVVTRFIVNRNQERSPQVGQAVRLQYPPNLSEKSLIVIDQLKYVE
jgi:hypothetical protein